MAPMLPNSKLGFDRTVSLALSKLFATEHDKKQKVTERNFRAAY